MSNIIDEQREPECGAPLSFQPFGQDRHLPKEMSRWWAQLRAPSIESLAFHEGVNKLLAECEVNLTVVSVMQLHSLDVGLPRWGVVARRVVEER